MRPIPTDPERNFMLTRATNASRSPMATHFMQKTLFLCIWAPWAQGPWAHIFVGLAYFSPDLRVSATSAAPPATAHPSIKEAAEDVAETHKSGEK